MKTPGIAMAVLAFAMGAQAQNSYSIGSGPPPQGGLSAGKLPVNEPGAGNYFVGGPSDAYRGLVRDLDAKPATAEAFTELQTRIDALLRADLGEKPYDVKFGLKLRLLELEWATENALQAEAAANRDGATNFSGAPGPSPERLAELNQARAARNATLEKQRAILTIRRRAEISLPSWVKSYFSGLDAPRITPFVARYHLEDRFKQDLLTAVSGLTGGQATLATSALSPKATLVVTGVSDSPTRGNASPPIIVSIGVQAKTNGVMVRQIRVTQALDDFDRSLLLTSPNGAARPFAPLALPSLTAMYRAANRDEPTPLGGSVNLNHPLPGTRAIKLLEGEMEIYAPNVANGGVAEVPDFAAAAGRPIAHDVLKEAGIELMVVDSETYPGLQERLTFRGPTGFTQFFNLTARGAMLYVNDPNGRLGGILFRSPDGRFVDMTGSEGRPLARGGSLTLYKTGPAIPPGTTLLAYVNTPDATLVIPFRFENIPVQY